MGPEATAHFYRLLIRNTSAPADQEHIPVAIWADPRVPDRTPAGSSGAEPRSS
ncbi:MAG: aspartate/glutamate racemase family protein [Candidatus Aminicenantes bacterium]|nr:aspartate/glutamate racemase family protein [Candidatus Aminicenantes bacterium]